MYWHKGPARENSKGAHTGIDSRKQKCKTREGIIEQNNTATNAMTWTECNYTMWSTNSQQQKKTSTITFRTITVEFVPEKPLSLALMCSMDVKFWRAKNDPTNWLELISNLVKPLNFCRTFSVPENPLYPTDNWVREVIFASQSNAPGDPRAIASGRACRRKKIQTEGTRTGKFVATQIQPLESSHASASRDIAGKIIVAQLQVY